jgi:hypothetical protein
MGWPDTMLLQLLEGLGAALLLLLPMLLLSM